jgi:hypothetical protein
MDRADKSMSDKAWKEKAPSTDQSGDQPSDRPSDAQASQGGFVGSQAKDSGDYVQNPDDQDETPSQNRNSDVEGSSKPSGNDSSSQ